MQRRTFIVLAGAAVGWPLATGAQQRAAPVVGFLFGGSAERNTAYVAAFRRGLSETGYVEGQNVAMEYRWAEGRSDRYPVLAADLARGKVAVILAAGASGTPANVCSGSAAGACCKSAADGHPAILQQIRIFSPPSPQSGLCVKHIM